MLHAINFKFAFSAKTARPQCLSLLFNRIEAKEQLTYTCYFKRIVKKSECLSLQFVHFTGKVCDAPTIPKEVMRCSIHSDIMTLITGLCRTILSTRIYVYSGGIGVICFESFLTVCV